MTSLPSFADLTRIDIRVLRAQIHALNNPYQAPFDYMNINPPLRAKAHDDSKNPPATFRDTLQHLLHKLDCAMAFLERDRGNQASAILDGVNFALQIARSQPRF